MKKILLAGVACLAFSAGAASAADLSAKAPYPVKAPIAVVPSFTWTGFYIGANVGYGWGSADTNTPFYDYIYTADVDPSGWFGGGQVGYNYQFENNVVLGVEADIEFGSLTDSVYFNDYFDIYGTSKVDYFGTARVRLGYAIDHFLPYITGGLAWAHNEVRATVFDGDVAYSGSDDTTSIGWTIGGGVEYAITDNWTVKAEYLYADLGSDNYNAVRFDDIYSTNVDLKIQTVKMGVNYKF